MHCWWYQTLTDKLPHRPGLHCPLPHRARSTTRARTLRASIVASTRCCSIPPQRRTLRIYSSGGTSESCKTHPRLTLTVS